MWNIFTGMTFGQSMSTMTLLNEHPNNARATKLGNIMLTSVRIFIAIFTLLAMGVSNQSTLQAKEATAKKESEKAPSKKGKKSDGWVQLFDGKTFGDWKPMEKHISWTIEDGCLKGNGKRVHLFYMAKDNDFKNFHLRAEIKTMENSNSGIFFHTKMTKTNKMDYGYESQVNQTHKDPVKSGSLYRIDAIGKDVIAKAGVKDKEWYTHDIIVRDKHVVVKLNGKIVIDYLEPADIKGTRKLSHGTFALQAHDPISVVFFRKVEVRKLPDTIGANDPYEKRAEK